MKEVIIAPSILGVSKEDILEVIKDISNTNAKWLHVDVMDGKFVPNTSFSPTDVKYFKYFTNLFLDVHLMINDVLDNVLDYINAKPNLISFHYEAIKDINELNKIVKLVKENNIQVGLVIKPNTKVSEILPYIHLFDLVLVMSVEPGKGGQEFMDSSIDKIKELRKYIDDNKLSTLIEVDGGINYYTAPKVKEAGVDVIVSGSYIISSDDMNDAVNSLM